MEQLQLQKKSQILSREVKYMKMNRKIFGFFIIQCVVACIQATEGKLKTIILCSFSLQRAKVSL